MSLVVSSRNRGRPFNPATSRRINGVTLESRDLVQIVARYLSCLAALNKYVSGDLYPRHGVYTCTTSRPELPLDWTRILGWGCCFVRSSSTESGKSVSIWGRGGMFRSVDLPAHLGYRMLRHELLNASLDSTRVFWYHRWMDDAHGRYTNVIFGPT